MGTFRPRQLFEYACHPDDLEFISQLGVWFDDPAQWHLFEPEKCNEFGQVIREGSLSAISIARACLQTRYIDGKYLAGELFEDVNDLVGELALGAGIRLADSVQSWQENIDTFFEGLLSQLELLNRIDPSSGSQQFLLWHDGQRVRFRPFGAFGLNQFDEKRLPNGSLLVARGNVLQPGSRFSEEKISTLEELINGDAPEQDFQEFFEEHDEFLLALGDYTRIHAQLVLSEDDGGRMIPDFFLERFDSSLADICDLKRANVELVRAQRNRRRFRDAVAEAVAQLRTYADYFDDASNRNAFKNAHGFTAFRPRVVMIVGRRQSFDDDIDRVKLMSGIPNWVDLRTYDDVVAKARQWRHLAAK